MKLHPHAHLFDTSAVVKISRRQRVPNLQETRIIVAGTPRLLGDLLEDAIARQPDFNLVARLSSEREIVGHVRQFDADVVIIGLAADDLEETCGPLLRAFPHLVVISLTRDQRLLLRCELVLQVRERGEASIDGLVAEIRGSVRRRDA
jgi:hypothetical protein